MTEFVPLEFPSWLRWGQRKGAFIDNEALAAIYPDHRRYVRVADGEAWRFERVGTVYHCGWCGNPCAGRRTAWCSNECSDRFYRVWSWGAVSKYVAQRDGFKCQRCPYVDVNRLSGGHYAGLQCDHVVPVKDGGTDEPANLRSLCHDCHVAVGYEQRRARKAQLAPELSLATEDP